jgi:hypothetical protein
MGGNFHVFTPALHTLRIPKHQPETSALPVPINIGVILERPFLKNPAMFDSNGLFKFICHRNAEIVVREDSGRRRVGLFY